MQIKTGIPLPVVLMTTAMILLCFVAIEISYLEQQMSAQDTQARTKSDSKNRPRKNRISNEEFLLDDQDSHINFSELLMRDHAELLACPGHRRPLLSKVVTVDSVWQLHRSAKSDTYIYSAFYDDRPAAGLVPSIRIIILATFYQNMTAFCHLWFETVEEPMVVEAVLNETGAVRYVFFNKGYREYTFTCQLPAAYPIPGHVSITSERCGNYSTYKEIIFAPRRKPVHDFGICVANGHGHFRPELMIEWFELHRMFGVTEFNLYDTLYVNMTEVFDYYKNIGVLKLFPLPHPLDSSGLNTTHLWYEKVRNLRSVALNDCLHRNMYRYRFLVVVDHDEFIVPKMAANYNELLAQTDKHHCLQTSYHSYTFLNTYFLLDFEQDKTKPEFLRTARYRYRALPRLKIPYYAPKSFVNPLTCFNLFNHFCITRFPEYAAEISKIVPFEIGASHHYRKCGHFWRSNCAWLMKQKTPDHIMLRYEDTLTIRVTKILRIIGVDYIFNVGLM